MAVFIREVQISDCADICNLINHELELGLDVKLDVLIAQINKMKVTGSHIIKVAVYDTQIVGFIAAYKNIILEMPDEYMRIIGLSVAKPFRRKGIGTQLMQAVIRYADEHNIDYIALNTLPNADADHAFYQANGFEKKSVCYSKALRQSI